MSKMIISLDEAVSNSLSLVGSKGLFLGKIIKINTNVPFGFIVSTEAFEFFLRENSISSDLDAYFCSIEPSNTVLALEKLKLTRKNILNSVFPKTLEKQIVGHYAREFHQSLVAVRSSATIEDGLDFSWAGQFKSYLNVREQNILDFIKKCWAAIFSLKTLQYYHYRKSSQVKFSFAVIVQSMLASEISGVTFTVSPEKKHQKQLLIESVYGLGTGITSGEINADSYLYDKINHTILRKQIVKQTHQFIYNQSQERNVLDKVKENLITKQKLTDQQIREIALLSCRLEKHFRKPLDIEWAIEKNKIFIIQVRPIVSFI